MMKQNADKRIDNILIKLPESMRAQDRKTPGADIATAGGDPDPDEHGHAADQRWQRV